MRRKIIEEAAELAAAVTDEHTTEEMADLEELLDELLELRGIDCATVRDAQNKKREKRGGFAERILMLTGVTKNKE